MAGRWNVRKRILIAVLIIALAETALLAADRPAPLDLPGTSSPLKPVFHGLRGDEIFTKLLEHNRLRNSHLLQYAAERTYRVSNDKGKVHAEEVVNVRYQAPDRKSFVTVSEEGSPLVRHLVLKRLIESEKETASGREHRNSSIEPSNYSFFSVGEEDLGPYHCYVVQAIPLRADKYLFVGKVWISAEDFAIVRIEGQPARNLSFWITRADFVRQYQKIGDFWLPAKDETLVRVRLNGNKVLTIDHRNYMINSATEEGTHELNGDKRADGR